LALHNEFEVNSTLDIEERDEHFFICDFDMQAFLGWGYWLIPLQTFSFFIPSPP
jgi:hypothetical protein